MAIELEKLLFSVDTGQLKDALDKIDAISSSVSKLASATNKLNKTTEDEVKTKKNKTKATEEAAKAEETLAENTKQSTTVLERQKDILKFQTEGFSKGQSSVLAYAKATGAATSEIKELGEVLQMQRKLIGGDPFDKSISGLVALQNQYGELREAVRQYNKDVELTRNQTRELARDKERIIEKMKLEGASFSQIKEAIRAHNNEYVRQADLVNKLISQERLLEKAQQDKLNAIRNIQSAEERARSTLDALNMETAEGAQMNERAALAVAAYERNLRLAGVSAEQAAKKSAIFRQQQAEIAKASSRNQMDYLARGVGVQLGDVGVSLASGMNPLTVAIQQGDQLRSIIQQVGPNTKDMEKVMATAVTQIASSFALLGTAVSSFVKGAIVSLGEFIVTSAKIDKAMQYAVENAVLSKEAAEKLGKTLSAVSGIAMTGFIGAIGAVTLAMFQMLEANKQLDQELAKRGALLGLTSTEIRGMAKELAGTKTTLATTTEAFAAFASSSITNSEMLNKAVSEAIKNNRSLGLSYEEQAKIYDKLSDKPVKALIDLNKEMGITDAASIRRINKLWEEGKAQEAVVLAQEKYMQGMENVRKIADANKTEIAKLWTEIKDAAIAAWTEVQKIGDDTFWKGVRTLFAAMKTALSNIFSVLKGVVAAAWNLMQGKIDAAMNSWQGIDAEIIQNQEEYTNKLKEIWTIGKASGEDAKRLALERQKNAKDSIGLEEKLRKEKEEAGKIQNAYNSYMKTFGDILAEATGKQELLTKAEVKMMEVLQSEYWAKLTPEMKKNVLMKYDLARASELVANALKAESEAIKSWSKVQKNLQNQNVELDKRNQVIENELDLLGLVGVEREKATREMELQNKYAAAQARYEKTKLDIIQEYTDAQAKAAKEVLDPNSRQKIYKDNADQYEAAMKQAEELLNKERIISRKEVDKSIAESYYKEMQRVSDMLADVLITALTEGGKAGSKKLGDYIKKELLSASSMFISSIIRAQLGNFMQSAFGVNAGNYPGGTLASNLVQSVQGMPSFGGMNSVGSGFTNFAMSSFGQKLGLSETVSGVGRMGLQATTLTDLGQTIQEGADLVGKYGGYLNSAYQLSQGRYGAAAGSAIGTYFGGPVGSFVGSQIGGMLDTAFGSSGAPKSMIGGGGRISSGKASFDPTGQMHWTDYTSQDKNLATSIISDQLVQALKKINSSYSAGAYVKGEINVKGSSSNQMLASATNEAGNLIYHFFQETGKGIEDFNKFVQEQVPKIQLALVVDAMRSSGEDYKEIANLIVGDSDNLTESLKDVSQEGIAAMQSSLSSAMQAFEIAGNMFEEIGVKISGQDFKKVAEATGGFDNLTALLGSYYENFYSAEEKRIHGMKNLVESFNEQTGSSLTLEKALSLTKTEFRDLYEESVRLLGVANPTAVAMLKVAGSFAELNNEADEVIKTVGSLKLTTSVKTELDDSLSFIEDYVQSSKELIEEQYSTALASENQKLESAKETFNTIKSQADSLKNALNSISYFREFSTGSSSTLEDVRNALGSTGSSDYFKLMGITYDAIGNLKTDAEKQLDVAKEQVQAIERQIKAIEESKQEQVSKLDAMLQKAKDQYDAIFKVEKAVNSLADAINKLAAAAAAATQKVAPPAPDGVLSQESINKAVSDTITGFNGDLAAAADTLYGAAIQYGVSAEQLAIALGKNPEDIKQWAENKGLPPLVDSTTVIVKDAVNSTAGAVIDSATSAINTVGTSLSVDIPEHLKKAIDAAGALNAGKDIDGFEDSLYAISKTFGYTAEQIATATNNSVEFVNSMLSSAESRGASQYASDTFYFEQSQKTSELIDKIVSDATEGVTEVVENTVDDVDKLLNIIRERESLMLQEWQLLGDIESIRKLEISKIDESNRAIQERIWKIEDERTAYDNLENSFNKYINALKDKIAELEESFGETDKAFDALSKVVETEKVKKAKELEALNATKNSLVSLIDSISESIKSLRREVEPTNKLLVQTAKGILNSAIAGTVVNENDLLEAVGVVSESVTTSIYQTKVDQERAYLLLANDLEALNAVNKNNLSSVEQQVLLLETQIKSLDDILETAKKQIDAVRMLDTSVLTVDQAVRKLNEAVSKESTAREQITALNLQIEQATKEYDLAKMQYESTLGIRTDIESLKTAFVSALGNLSTLSVQQPTSSATGTNPSTQPAATKPAYETFLDASGYTVVKTENAAIGFAPNITDFGMQAALREVSSPGILQWAKDNNIPGYANGGNYQGGLALVGEEGPELINFNKPGMVYNNNQTASILSGDSSLSDKVERLAEAVEMLRYEARATAVNTSKMAKQLDRTSDQGDTLRVTVVA